MENRNPTSGTIVEAVGPVVDVRFESECLPEILTALKIPFDDGRELTVEVMQHIGDDIVRCVAMGPTDGLVRGMKAISTGGPISVPVGGETLGRMFNVFLKTRQRCCGVIPAISARTVNGKSVRKFSSM